MYNIYIYVYVFICCLGAKCLWTIVNDLVCFHMLLPTMHGWCFLNFGWRNTCSENPKINGFFLSHITAVLWVWIVLLTEKMVPWARLLVFERYLRKKHGRHGWTPWKNWCLKHFNRDPLYQGFKKRVPNQLAKNHQKKVMMFPSKHTETSNLGDGHLSWDHVWTKLKSWLTLDTVRHGWVGNMSGYGNRDTNIGT